MFERISFILRKLIFQEEFADICRCMYFLCDTMKRPLKESREIFENCPGRSLFYS